MVKIRYHPLLIPNIPLLQHSIIPAGIYGRPLWGEIKAWSSGPGYLLHHEVREDTRRFFIYACNRMLRTRLQTKRLKHRRAYNQLSCFRDEFDFFLQCIKDRISRNDLKVKYWM